MTRVTPHPCRLGLTGGIGSGKTTVGKRLQALGADLIDADAISRATTAVGGDALAAIAAAFGPDMIAADGAMDRARMRALVFAQPEARHKLEAIVHPLVATAIAARAAASKARCVVFDVPLLVESTRWRPQLDQVVVVDLGADLVDAVQRLLGLRQRRDAVCRRIPLHGAIVGRAAAAGCTLLRVSFRRREEARW
mgnify:CR=1 FL=1